MTVRRAVPAAAGYPQYSGNLSHPIISQELIERFYQTSIFGEISTTEYLGELTKGGDQITFWREPTVVVRDYVKGGVIQHDTLDTEPVTLVIDKAKTFSLKIDKIDEKQMQMWDVLKAAFMQNASRTMADMIDGEILGSVYADVDSANQGATAGVVSGDYNLGATGAPVAVTASNVVEVFTSLHGVLNEAAIPREGRFIVIPSLIETVLLNSDLKAAYLTGMAESPMLNGKLPNTIAGFDVYITDRVPRVYDSGVSAWCHHILAGTKAGIVFATQLEDTRVIEDANSWATHYQGLQVYGFDVIQPTALAHLYARL